MIRAGEGRLVAYGFLLTFLGGVGIALGRLSAMALFLKRFGVEHLPFALLLASLLMVVANLAYGVYADRVGKSRLSLILLGILAMMQVAVWLAMDMSGETWVYMFYFLVTSLAGEVIASHYSEYFNSCLDPFQGKRLLPVISAGERLGAIIGGLVVALSASWMSVDGMVLLWLSATLFSMSLVVIWQRSEGAPAKLAEKAKRPPPWVSIMEGMRYARSSRFVQITGLGVFLLVILVTVQEYLSSVILNRLFSDEGELTRWLAILSMSANVLTLFCQLLVTPRLLKRFGLRVVSLIFPLTTFASFMLAALHPSLIAAAFGTINYRGFMRAFRHPTYSLYYNAVPPYIRSRTRSFVAGLVLPAGLVLASLILMAVPTEWAVGVLGWAGVFAAIAYVAVKQYKNVLYGQNLTKLLEDQVFVVGRDPDSIGHLDSAMEDRLVRMMASAESADELMVYAELLVNGAADKAVARVAELSPELEPAVRCGMLSLLADRGCKGWQGYARQCLSDPDVNVRARALGQLWHKAPSSLPWQLVYDWLDPASPRPLRESAARVALACDDAQLRQCAIDRVADLIGSNEPDDLRDGLRIIAASDAGQWLDVVQRCRAHADPQVRAAAVYCMARLLQASSEQVAGVIWLAVEDRDARVRLAAIRALLQLKPISGRLAVLRRLFHDPDFDVRKAAMEALSSFDAGADEFALLLTDPTEEFELLKLLVRAVKGSSLPGKDKILHEALAHQVDAAELKTALVSELAQLSRETPEHSPERFIELILQEEVGRHIGFALDLLECMDLGQTASTIRAAWHTDNPRLRAYSLETLMETHNHPMVRRLLHLLEGTLAPGGRRAVVFARDWPAILAECRARGSAWLRQCADTVAAKTAAGRV